MNDRLKNLVTQFALNPNSAELNFQMGSYYEDLKQYSSAGSYYLRSAERSNDDLLVYESLLGLATCLISLGRRRYSAKGILSLAISYMPSRPEAYYLMSKHVEQTDTTEEKWFSSYMYASTGLNVCNFNDLKPLRRKTSCESVHSLIFQKAYAGSLTGLFEESRSLFQSLLKDETTPINVRKLALSNLMRIKKENSRAQYYHAQSDLDSVYSTSLAKYVTSRGGSVHPIIVPHSLTSGKATINASVFVNKDQDIYVNLRETNYTLYYSNKFPSEEGPLKCLYPDNDVNMRSENVLCRLDDRFNVVSADRVDMRLNEEPNWFYIGLEDARIFEWNDKTYLCGVRRDHIKEGRGRMDLSEIEITENGVIEVERFSMPAPGKDDSYCEKNWMPILDEPFRWVKWTNPTQVVSFNTEPLSSKTEILDESKTYNFPRDLRGGSQVIRWNEDYYLAVTHECEYGQNNSSRRYYHRIVVWDRNWNIVCSTREFSMMGGATEFVAGIAYHKDDVLISFGYEDNASFILRIPKNVFDDFVLRG